MYDVQILKKIISTQDLDSLIKIDQVKSFIFQPPEYRDFFSTVLDYVTKYGEFPSNNYLDDFFGTERNSPLNDVWDQVKSSNDVDYPLLSVVDLQVTHNLRQGIIGATHSTNVQLKTSNNSESNGIILDFQSRINEMVSITEKLHSKEEMLSGETALTTVKAYHEKTQGQGYYISKYGYDFIDDVQGGVERSGFIGILASAKQRKSTFLRQMLYKQLIQGHNVGLITLEMSLESVREHMYILHANNNNIWGLSHPYISISKIRSGAMTKEEKSFYHQVIEDFTNNESYGKMIIKQPMGSYNFDNMTIDITSMKAKGCILVGIDYLALVKPSVKGRMDNDSYNDMIMNTRYMSLSLEVTIVSPIQANREGYAKVQKSKDLPCYDLTAIHMYSAFEKGCTSIISVIQTDEMRATNQIAIGSVVNREAPPFDTMLMTLHNDSGTFSVGEVITSERAISIISEIDL